METPEKPVSSETKVEKNPNNATKVPSYRSTGFQYNIESYSYPPIKDNAHFIRFFINLDEESKLLTGTNPLLTRGDVDQTDQNRVRNEPLDQAKFEASAEVLGAIAGVVSPTVKANSKLDDSIKQMKGFKGNASRQLVDLYNKAPVRAALGAGAGLLLSKTIDVSKKLKRLAANITLYMPNNIGMSQTVNWENYEDVLPELLKNGVSSGVAEALSNPNASWIDRGSDASGKISDIAKKATRIVATAGSQFVQSATRTAFNPKRDMLFDSVGRRSFTFDYQFAPITPKEAIEVANIIYMFRMFALPEVIDGYNAFLFTYPAEFDIEYGYNVRNEDGSSSEEQNKYLNKISSCVLQNVNVNYSPNGSFQTLQAGEPVQVNMTLQFLELETMHRDRVTKGY